MRKLTRMFFTAVCVSFVFSKFSDKHPEHPGLGVQVRAQLIILISCQIMSKLASLKNRLRIDYVTFTRKLMTFPAWLQMPVKI